MLSDSGQQKGDAGKPVRLVPVVTGLSPKEGIPGTQITIRGENLGQNQNDLIGLYICGTDCVMSARWESPHKVIARVGQAKGGLGDVVIATKSGGKGTGTVKFRVYTVQIGPLQESAVWVDESRTVPGREAAGANTAALVDDDPLGISDEKDDFQDLKTGLAYMQRQAKAMHEGPKDLLKSNLYSFISCVDSLAALHEKLELEKNTRGWPLTKGLADKVEETNMTAEKLFSDVLRRKDNADQTRNAVSVLTRFKFIFFLPKTIENNIEKGEYSMVLNDYARAKSLFKDTDVPLFKEAMVEVDDRMIVFKQTLKDRLVTMPSTFEEQQKIINVTMASNIFRYLLALEPDSDPSWDCITAHHCWLENVLWMTQSSLWDSSKATSGVSSASESGSDVDEKLVREVPQRFEFVNATTNILATKLQSFWKLAQAYVSGTLAEKPALHREDDVEQMLINTVNVASWLMLNAMLPDTLPGSVKAEYSGRFEQWPVTGQKRNDVHLLAALRSIRNCVSTLLDQDFTLTHVQPLTELCTTLRLKCLSIITEKTRDAVWGLQAKENWKTGAGEVQAVKTQLPDRFENQIAEILPYVSQILSHNAFRGELDLFAKQRCREMIIDMFELMLCSLKDTIERLVRFPKESTYGGGGHRPTDLQLNTSSGSAGGSKDTVKGKRLLMSLSNVDYVLHYSLSNICQRLADNGVKYADLVMQRCRQAFVGLRTGLIKAYVASKCAPFSDLVASVAYRKTTEVRDVSNYVKDVVLCVVFVQAELFLVAPQFAEQILALVVRAAVEKLCEKVNNDVGAGDVFDQSSSTQAAVDMAAFEESVNAFLSTDTRSLINSARSKFSTKVDHPVFQQVLGNYREKMRLTLLSLQDATANDTSSV